MKNWQMESPFLHHLPGAGCAKLTMTTIVRPSPDISCQSADNPDATGDPGPWCRQACNSQFRGIGDLSGKRPLNLLSLVPPYAVRARTGDPLFRSPCRRRRRSPLRRSAVHAVGRGGAPPSCAVQPERHARPRRPLGGCLVGEVRALLQANTAIPRLPSAPGPSRVYAGSRRRSDQSSSRKRRQGRIRIPSWV